MSSASGASNVRTTASSPRRGSLRSLSRSTCWLSHRTNTCSHKRRVEPSALLGRSLAPETELVGALGERVDHELEVSVEVEARVRLQLSRPGVNVLAVDARREARLLELLL